MNTSLFDINKKREDTADAWCIVSSITTLLDNVKWEIDREIKLHSIVIHSYLILQ